MSLKKLKHTIARLAWLNGTGPQPKARRDTPREILARHLTRDHGLRCEAEDIWWIKGAWSHIHFDCTERGRVAAVDKNGKKVEISLADSVTLCARFGVTLEANPNDFYGAFVATANPFDCKSR